MANYQSLKTPVFAGINDVPVIPTSIAAGNASDLIDRVNDLVDAVQTDVTAAETNITTLQGRTDLPVVVLGNNVSPVAHTATANSTIAIVGTLGGVNVTLPTDPPANTFVRLSWACPFICTLTRGGTNTITHHNGTAFVTAATSATFANTTDALNTALCVFVSGVWQVTGTVMLEPI